MKEIIKNKLRRVHLLKGLHGIMNIFDYDRDKRFFIKNFMYSRKNTKEKLEYDMLLRVHKLEKGFSVTKNLRPFGTNEVVGIIDDLNEYEKRNYATSFARDLAYSALAEYLRFYEEKKWCDSPQYRSVSMFMSQPREYRDTPVGSFDNMREDFIEEATNVDYDKFISSRRSIRNFSAKPLAKKDIEAAVKIAIKTPTACNRQMCKVYYTESKHSKEIAEQYGQGLGLFDLVNANYFIITFDVSANYFTGERSQGWFNAGLFAMNFVNGLHSLGIGSCCVQFGNTFKEEKKFKRELMIPETERIAVIVVAGYYDKISRIPCSARKPLAEIYRER